MVIFVAVGIVIFVACYLLVYRVGAQFIKIAPSTEPVINMGVPVISFLMTVVALLQIYSLFRPNMRG